VDGKYPLYGLSTNVWAMATTNSSTLTISVVPPISFDPKSDYFMDVAKGNIPGHSVLTIFGRNKDLDPAAAALIWDYGPIQSLEVPLLVDTELFVSSTSVSDTNIGMLITGMTDDYVTKTVFHVHTIDQDQESIGSWFRLDKMTIISGDAPLGDLYIAESDTVIAGVPNTPAKVHGFMEQGTNVTHKASGTVPANHTLYVGRLFLGVRRGEDCVFSFYAKPFGAPDFIEASDFPVYQSALFETFAPPFPITEKTDFQFRGETVTNNTQASANIGAILVDNTVG
jgi:hypothetical protein